MPFNQPMPEQAIADAAVTLGRYILTERGRFGVRAYLLTLGELMPREWTEQIARALELPPPMPAPRPDPPNAQPPPEPRGSKPDMEKMLKLMQLMGTLNK